MAELDGAEVDGAEVLSFRDAAEWESWLARHHERPAGVWLKIAKKGSGETSVTIGETLDVALCYGWIDSQRRSFDQHHYLQRYSRRRPGSAWSRVNVDKVEALIAAGRIRPPGLAEIAAARADGRWDAAYESQRTVTVPPDLAAALAGSEPARRAFERLDKTSRYAVILPLLKARTPASRAARLRRAVETLAAGDVGGGG
ncbi:MAG: OmdA domain containing protein [Micromonosporaceae bacterium]|nr:OmdA domain containing protein [Micromonosporaceae bacterium]